MVLNETSGKKQPVYYRGRGIFDAVFEELFENYGLGNATELFYTGCNPKKPINLDTNIFNCDPEHKNSITVITVLTLDNPRLLCWWTQCLYSCGLCNPNIPNNSYNPPLDVL